VKEFFREAAREGLGTLVNKTVITPSRREVVANPRARSAKLRVFERGVKAMRDSEPLQSPYTYA
jgi:16S rRNA (cytosine1402-N4)-methyltransferase